MLQFCGMARLLLHLRFVLREGSDKGLQLALRLVLYSRPRGGKLHGAEFVSEQVIKQTANIASGADFPGGYRGHKLKGYVVEDIVYNLCGFLIAGAL